MQPGPRKHLGSIEDFGPGHEGQARNSLSSESDHIVAMRESPEIRAQPALKLVYKTYLFAYAYLITGVTLE